MRDIYDGCGLIHEKSEIKMLILFVLIRLPKPISEDKLWDLVSVDGGFNYFDYKVCLSELLDTNNVYYEDHEYTAAENGIRNCKILEPELPVIIKQRALEQLKPVAAEMARSQQVIAEHETDKQGTTVHLYLNDGMSTLLDLRLMVFSPEQAKTVEDNFNAAPEKLYDLLINNLLEQGS